MRTAGHSAATQHRSSWSSVRRTHPHVARRFSFFLGSFILSSVRAIHEEHEDLQELPSDESPAHQQQASRRTGFRGAAIDMDAELAMDQEVGSWWRGMEEELVAREGLQRSVADEGGTPAIRRGRDSSDPISLAEIGAETVRPGDQTKVQHQQGLE